MISSAVTGKGWYLNAPIPVCVHSLAPLSLRELSLMKMQDLVDDNVIVQTALPEELRNPTPVMPDINISEPGILKLLKNLKLKKSADPEWIKHVILQGLRDELVPILKVLFDRSLNPVLCHIYGTQQMPHPYSKKGEKSAASNYRHFSLSYILCKVMEQIIASNVVKHFDSNGLMYDLQHGFMERHSSETQLVSIIEDIARKSRKSNGLFSLIFLSPSTSSSIQSSFWNYTPTEFEEKKKKKKKKKKPCVGFNLSSIIVERRLGLRARSRYQ